jgi:VanZ family protein
LVNAKESDALMRSFLKYWLPVLIWLGIMFVGSTGVLSAEQTSRFLIPFVRWLKPDISTEALAQIHFVVRKLGHIFEYAILATLLWRALRGGTNLRMKTSFLFAAVWLTCGVFAVSDEFHQLFMPSRTAASSDVLIDICGATIGLAICLMISREHSSAARINLA